MRDDEPAATWDTQAVIRDLRTQIAGQHRQIIDLERQNSELRAAVSALMQPAPSELLSRNLTHPSRIRGSDE